MVLLGGMPRYDYDDDKMSMYIDEDYEEGIMSMMIKIMKSS